MVLFFNKKKNKQKLMARIEREVTRTFNIECSVYLDGEGDIEVYIENQSPKVEAEVKAFVSKYRNKETFIFVNNDIEDLLEDIMFSLPCGMDSESRRYIEKQAYNRYLVDADCGEDE